MSLEEICKHCLKTQDTSVRHCSLVLHEVTEEQCRKIKEEHEIDEGQIK